MQGAPVADARALLRVLADAFPGAPGVVVRTCDLEIRAKHQALLSTPLPE